MSDQAAISSPVPVPGSFTFRGATHRFAPMDTLEVVTRFEKWMLAEARRNLEDLRDIPGEDVESRQEFRRDVAAGLYKWTGVMRWKFFQTGPGQRAMMLFQFQAHDPGATSALVDAIFADQKELDRISTLMISGQNEDEPDPDPNAKTPGTKS
jgi:hypothetical protein